MTKVKKRDRKKDKTEMICYNSLIFIDALNQLLNRERETMADTDSMKEREKKKEKK